MAELGFQRGMWPGTTPPSPDAPGGRLSIFDCARQAAGTLGRRPNPCAAGDFFAPHGICVDSHRRHLRRRSRPFGRAAIAVWCHPPVTRCRNSLTFRVRRNATAQPICESCTMKAWRFYHFNDMRLDDVAEPVCGPGHVLVEPLCVQPSVTEAQLAQGIPTLAFDRVKHRLETEAPFNSSGTNSVPVFSKPDLALAVFGPATVWRRGPNCLARIAPSADRAQRPLPQGAGHRLRPSRLLRGTSLSAGNRPRQSGRTHLRQRGGLPASLSDSVAAVETAQIADGGHGGDLRSGQHGTGVLADRSPERSGPGHHRGRARGVVPDLARAGGGPRLERPHHGCRHSDPRTDRRQRRDVVFECAAAVRNKDWPAIRRSYRPLTPFAPEERSWEFPGSAAPFSSTSIPPRAQPAYLFPDISTQAHLEHTVRLVASGRVRFATITHVLSGIESVPKAFEITANKGKYGRSIQDRKS